MINLQELTYVFYSSSYSFSLFFAGRAGSARKLLLKAKEFGFDSLALTDHGVLYGAIEFYSKAKELGIKPIIGVELYLAPRSLRDKMPKIDNKNYHLTLLAKNEEGYQNHLKLVTIGELEGFIINLELINKL